MKKTKNEVMKKIVELYETNNIDFVELMEYYNDYIETKKTNVKRYVLQNSNAISKVMKQKLNKTIKFTMNEISRFLIKKSKLYYIEYDMQENVFHEVPIIAL